MPIHAVVPGSYPFMLSCVMLCAFRQARDGAMRCTVGNRDQLAGLRCARVVEAQLAAAFDLAVGSLCCSSRAPDNWAADTALQIRAVDPQSGNCGMTL